MTTAELAPEIEFVMILLNWANDPENWQRRSYIPGEWKGVRPERITWIFKLLIEGQIDCWEYIAVDIIGNKLPNKEMTKQLAEMARKIKYVSGPIDFIRYVEIFTDACLQLQEEAVIMGDSLDYSLLKDWGSTPFYWIRED